MFKRSDELSRPVRASAFLIALASVAPAIGAEPCGDPSGAASARAEDVLRHMSQSEKLSLTLGVIGAPWGGQAKPREAIGSAGYVPGVPRLGIPALQETDAELGVANPGDVRPGDVATAMPSSLSLASSWDTSLARRQGEIVASEARGKGFNVLLGGASNLIRDPRGGRDFEYLSEDPLLTGVMAGAEIAGAQSAGVISTLKHFALNDQETDRVMLDVRIDPAAARELDLLAFEIAIEHGRPGAVMCAYNQVNGAYSCENDWLLNKVLKGDWGYRGFVMSDWGAVHSTANAALAGLDQESGAQLDTRNFFDDLGPAVAAGSVPQGRLDDMALRILRSVYACGAPDPSPTASPDLENSDDTALAVEREGIVLLQNRGLLPLSPETRRIVVVGAHADRGVPSGGGSSQVIPRGGIALRQQEDNDRAMVFDPSSPLEEIRKQFPHARVEYRDGVSSEEAAKAAASADVAIVFADQYRTEFADATSLQLPHGQERLIESIARANRRTVVVLETGGPVLTPWLGLTAGLMEAWYPGQKGGQAIAEILSGAVNPSGHLPVSFPARETQLPHPKIDGDPVGAPSGPVGRGGRYGRVYTAHYDEGSTVGYRWFAAVGTRPEFPFGYGLSYTNYDLRDLTAEAIGLRVEATAVVANTAQTRGTATAQFYVSGPDGRSFPLRLAGWSCIDLSPGEKQTARIVIDPRLLANFDEVARRWRIAKGTYVLRVGFDAAVQPLTASFSLPASDLAP